MGPAGTRPEPRSPQDLPTERCPLPQRGGRTPRPRLPELQTMPDAKAGVFFRLMERVAVSDCLVLQFSDPTSRLFEAEPNLLDLIIRSATGPWTRGPGARRV